VDPGTTEHQALFPRRLRGRSSSRLRVSTAIDLLIRDLLAELTDQRTAGSPDRRRTGCPPRRAAPLQLDMLFGSKSIFDFAELVKDTIPIDPARG
jgi:hypothetical protein